MKRITGFSVLCLAATMFVGFAWADDPAPTAPTVPTLATGAYVELAYDSLDDKKQDKITNANNAGNNIAIDNSGKINLDLSAVQNGTDGVYVLTATKDANNQITLKWENIERQTIKDLDM